MKYSFKFFESVFILIPYIQYVNQMSIFALNVVKSTYE